MKYVCNTLGYRFRPLPLRAAFFVPKTYRFRSYSSTMKGSIEASSEPAKDFVNFLNASPTPFHAVKSLKDRFTAAGFEEIRERDNWTETCKPGGKYFLTRNASTIVAFAVGAKWTPGKPPKVFRRCLTPIGNPIAMIGAHTDSPCLRVKPISKAQSDGYLQVGCECYGGGLWHTWFDRDLSIAGRAMVKTPKGEFHQKLVRIDRPSKFGDVPLAFAYLVQSFAFPHWPSTLIAKLNSPSRRKLSCTLSQGSLLPS
jgi:aspartyl aminopeptidase